MNGICFVGFDQNHRFLLLKTFIFGMTHVKMENLTLKMRFPLAIVSFIIPPFCQKEESEVFPLGLSGLGLRSFRDRIGQNHFT
jgi:hypothetical protein